MSARRRSSFYVSFFFQNTIIVITDPPVSASPGNRGCVVRTNTGRCVLLLCFFSFFLLRTAELRTVYMIRTPAQQGVFVSSVFAFGLSVEIIDIGSFRFWFY